MSRFLAAIACVCVISAAVSAKAQTDQKKEKSAAAGVLKAEEKKTLRPSVGPGGEKPVKTEIDIFQAGKRRRSRQSLSSRTRRPATCCSATSRRSFSMSVFRKLSSEPIRLAMDEVLASADRERLSQPGLP